MKVIEVPYRPNPKQALFHACGATEAVYGGSKGGGKTISLVMEAFVYGCEYPGSTIYIFRETYDELEANIINEWKVRVPAEAYRYHESKHIAYLYNGTKVYFRFVKNKADAAKYDGRSIDWLGVDELTKHEESTIQVLLSCVRSPKGFPPRFRGTCNPGNIGHLWVKNRYIIPTNKGAKMVKDEVTGNTIAFIPATVYDNFAIMENDPAYVRRLENLPPKKKQAYLHGDWDMYDGQAFEEWNYDIHTIEPIAIPNHWYRWRSVDNGYSDPFAWYWFAVDERGLVHIYREFTRVPSDPKLTYSQQAEHVMELSRKPVLKNGVVVDEYEPIGPTFCGHEAFASHPLAEGKTIAYYYSQGGVKNTQTALSDRRLRKATWHEYLKIFKNHDGNMISKVRIHRNCKKLIETLPYQVEDERDSEKVAETQVDHWYDGAGFGLIAWHVMQSRGIRVVEKEIPWPLKRENNEGAGGFMEYITW